MADKTQQLVLDALGRAATDAAGIALFGNKTAPGLFASTSSGRLAAQKAQDEGLLRVVRTEQRGKSQVDVCAITEKGLAFLMNQVNPKQVLEDFVRALEARQKQADEILAAARKMQTGLDALKGTAEKVLHHVQKPSATQAVGPTHANNGSEVWQPFVLSFLGQWRSTNGSEDCAIPDLFNKAREKAPGLTIGQFHDGLRKMHAQESIYLHPWTGPLYDIPDPPYALLVGHEIAYYASLR